jgi:hypothetical protein
MKVNICMFQKLLILSVKSGKFVERIYYSKPLSISVTGSKHLETLRRLFAGWSDEQGIEVTALPAAGSYRKYYRMKGQTRTAMGVYNPDIMENKAFLGFSRHFLSCGLSVPSIYAVDSGEECYLIQDLGDISLFGHLEGGRKNGMPDPASVQVCVCVGSCG